MERRIVGVARTVRGGAMRSRSHRISSLDSNSSGTQSIARSASRTASSMVETKVTFGTAPAVWRKASGPSCWRSNSWAWWRLAGITSSSRTGKPARAAARASQRPSGPAPIMATVSDNLGGLCGQGLGDVFGVGAGVEQVLGDAGALLGGEHGDGGQHPAQGYGNVVNVVHPADGFSGE